MKRETKELTFDRVRRDLVKWYRAEVKRVLEELLPRIERGDFSDLGDEGTYMDVDDPRFARIRPDDFAKVRATWDRDYLIEITCGIVLLKWAIDELPRYSDLRIARMVGCASRYAATLARGEFDGLGSGGSNWGYLARWCLAWDVRDADRRRRGRRHGGTVLQLVRPIPAHPLSSTEQPPGAA